MKLEIAWFGSSLVSSAWSGAATYYRGIVRALADRGHRVTCYEPDALERRDLAGPPWAEIVAYPPEPSAIRATLDRARGADLVIKASGVGVHDELLEHGVLDLQSPTTTAAFWDVDAPATLDRLSRDASDRLHQLIPRYDLVFSCGGGARITAAYTRLGARRCVPINSALDPATHYRVDPQRRFMSALGFLGNRMPEREKRVGQFFFEAAMQLPDHTCVLGGAGWEGKPLPPNVRYLGHVDTAEHNAFNSTPLAVLNLGRDAGDGFSPAPRVVEAAGAGACVITDLWEGLEAFLEPNLEVLAARDGEEVAEHVLALTPARARTIGKRALRRMLAQHTYAHRAIEVESALGETTTRTSIARPLSIVVLGLSITSSWGNGHATTYRGLVRALAERGNRVTFLERDVPWYASHRDLESAPWARVALYGNLDELRARFERDVRDADLVIVGSCVPDGIEVARWVQEHARGKTAFYDLDTPVTLAQLAAGNCSYLDRDLIPRFDLYLSFTGGPTLRRIESELGARRALALYCAIDPAQYEPETRPPRWDLGYMGTYSADRQAAVRRSILDPARALPDRKFIVAGPQYPGDIEWPENLDRIDHIPPFEHRAFYNQLGFALNLTRADMRAAGWSPSVRLFEAAACGIPVISDPWPGLDELFSIDHEVLIANDTEDVLRYLRDISQQERRAIGARALARIRAGHTAAHRAADVERYARS